jgi:cytosine/adenosine deaminase-related metal-dependent hydrolase
VLRRVDDRNRLYERGTVLVEDNRNTEVRSSRDDDADIAADRVVDCEGKLVMRGLVNAHTHLELPPLLGAFSDLDLLEMIGSTTAIFGQIADGEFDYLTEAGYELAALNLLVGGVSTINSQDVRPSAGAKTYRRGRPPWVLRPGTLRPLLGRPRRRAVHPRSRVHHDSLAGVDEWVLPVNSCTRSSCCPSFRFT